MTIAVYGRSENEDLLKLGFVKPISYLIDGVEQIDSVQCMFVNLPYRLINEKPNALDDLYHININYIDRDDIHYYRFVLEEKKKNKNMVEWRLNNVDVGFKSVSKKFFDVEDSTGNIKIALKDNRVTAELVFSGGKYSGNHKIVWENRKLDHQVFLKVGEQWKIQVRNNENDDEGVCDVIPNEGFTLVEKSQVEVFDAIQYDERDLVSEPEKLLPIYTETAFVFVAETAGIYRLKINNGIEVFRYEITVDSQ